MIIKIFAIIFEVILFFYFFDNTLKRKYDRSILFYIAGLICIAVMSVNDIIGLFVNYKAVILFLMFFIITTLLYSARFIKKLFISIELIVLLALADLLTYSVEKILAALTLMSAKDNIYNRTYLIIIASMLFFVLVKLCSKRSNHLKTNSKLSVFYNFIIIITPVITMFTFCVVYYCMQYVPYDNKIFTAVFIVSSSLLFVNYFVFKVLDGLLDGVRVQNDYKLMRQQYESQVKHFENLQNFHDSIKSLKHDLSNHIFCIRDFLNRGLINDAKNYIYSIDSKLTEFDVFSDSGNVIIDGLLNNKNDIFKSEQINVTQKVRIPKEMKIKNDDLCVVLSNLIDNAIEACKKIKSGKRFIDLSIDYKKGLLFISLKNNYEEEIKMNNGKIATSKKDKGFHGIGLKNVKSTVEKYNGYTEINLNDNIFEVNVFMCDIASEQ